MEKFLTLTFAGADGPVELRITAATVRQGVKRSRLRLEARQAGDADPDVAILRTFTYPDLTAATASAVGLPWPLAFDDFLQLPDAWVAEWEQAVYALNPHWLPGGGPASDPKA